MQTTWFFENTEESLWGHASQRILKLYEILKQPFRESSSLAQYMADHNMRLAVATSYMDDDMVALIRFMNSVNLPVVIWMVLDDQYGYWTNVKNIRRSLALLEHIEKSIQTNELKVDAIGIDLENPIQIAQIYDNPLKALTALWDYHWEIRNFQEEAQSKLEYAVYQTNCRVEFYAFSKIFHSFIGGGLTPPINCRVVSMNYTSLVPKWAQKMALKFMELNKFPYAVTALGIVGFEFNKTPGRLLGKELPKHLSQHTLVTALQNLKNRNGGKLPNQLYLFAFENAFSVVKFEDALSQVE